MTEHDVNFLELVFAIVSMLGRFAAAGWIAYVITNSKITIGWQAFLVGLVVIFGLGFDIQYKNPYDKNDTLFPAQKQSQTVEQINGETNGRYEYGRYD